MALNIRVADIQAVHHAWRERGAQFLTPPQDRDGEIRCYLRDPDGYLIEVGQTTGHKTARCPDHLYRGSTDPVAAPPTRRSAGQTPA
jgi:hypothetical protein